MTQNPYFDYDALVEDALRSVVRTAITSAAENGLMGDHHFYITFRTDAPGVNIPKRLIEAHPEDLTIVLQHEYWDLVVDEDGEDCFSVTLSFNDIHERLVIPFEAITGFADPSAKFGLQFQYGDDLEDSFDDDFLESVPLEDLPGGFPSSNDVSSKPDKDDSEPSGTSKVVELDAFRKK